MMLGVYSPKWMNYPLDWVACVFHQRQRAIPVLYTSSRNTKGANFDSCYYLGIRCLRISSKMSTTHIFYCWYLRFITWVFTLLRLGHDMSIWRYNVLGWISSTHSWHGWCCGNIVSNFSFGFSKIIHRTSQCPGKIQRFFSSVLPLICSLESLEFSWKHHDRKSQFLAKYALDEIVCMILFHG